MKIKLTFLALLIGILTTFTINAAASQLEDASSLLKDQNVSYVIKTIPSGLKVVTFMHLAPTEMCLFLKNKGIDVISVTNYAKDINDEDKLIESSIKC